MRASRTLLYSGLVATTIAAGAGIFLASRSARARALEAKRGRSLKMAIGVPLALGALGAAGALVKSSLKVISPEPARPKDAEDEETRGLSSPEAGFGEPSGLRGEELSGVGISEGVTEGTGEGAQAGGSDATNERRGKGGRGKGKKGQASVQAQTPGGAIGEDLTHGGLQDTEKRGPGATDLPEHSRGADQTTGVAPMQFDDAELGTRSTTSEEDERSESLDEARPH